MICREQADNNNVDNGEWMDVNLRSHPKDNLVSSEEERTPVDESKDLFLFCDVWCWNKHLIFIFFSFWITKNAFECVLNYREFVILNWNCI